MTRQFLALALTCGSIFMAGCNDSASTNSAAKPPNSNAATAAPVDTAAVESDIRKLMDTAAAALAKNDADAMEKIYADNYMLVNLDGSVQNKAERLASLRSGDAKYTAFSYSDINIRVKPEGDGAIAIAKLTMKGTNKGKPADGDYRVTQVYMKTKDGWKQVTAQATPIVAAPASDNKPKTETNANANK